MAGSHWREAIKRNSLTVQVDNELEAVAVKYIQVVQQN